MRNLYTLMLVVCFSIGTASGQQEFSGSVELLGLASSTEGNPFWMYSNQKGRLDAPTNIMGLAGANYSNSFNENNALTLGAAFFYQDGVDDGLHIDELYATYSHRKLFATLGLKHREERLMGLSSINGDILWSNNARAIPGLLLGTSAPIDILPWLDVAFELAHCELGNDRYVESARLHYKSLSVGFDIGARDRIVGKLKHYVQWGGNSPMFGQQPDGFSDFVKIFLGTSGGGEARVSDQINALGNHLGGYELNYSMQRENFGLDFYFQSLFEDTSGRELSNFPDGAWGVLFQPKKKGLVNGILYEYVQTVSQSGRPILNQDGIGSGGDNYFSSGTYLSGWSHQGNIIGLPFIQQTANKLAIRNNRLYAHHLGITGDFWKLNYKLKGSYVENLGTYASPIDPQERMIYLYGSFTFPTKDYGDFKLLTGYDHSNVTEGKVGFGLGYSKAF